MIPAHELIRWLRTLPAGAHVAIDEGGLCIIAPEELSREESDSPYPYLEIGGWPQDDDEDPAGPVTDDERSNGPRRT